MDAFDVLCGDRSGNEFGDQGAPFVKVADNFASS
ncbi:hypothetical protein FHS37_003545 [Streptomyces griseostramineus]|uniref:Uncharacterized protein n=1 Tax=Streptomyces griseomycini TaxID=66895 RepID=A0A7W7LZR9_9ACTN|nr:hypothetical protein [Streptomyces griseomycini]